MQTNQVKGVVSNKTPPTHNNRSRGVGGVCDGAVTRNADLLRKHGGKTGEELKAAGN